MVGFLADTKRRLEKLQAAEKKWRGSKVKGIR